MNRPHGFLHWVFPAILAFSAFDILQSGRDLSAAFTDLQSLAEPVRTNAVAWAQRGVSLLVVGAAAERIVSHFAYREPTPSPSLLLAFVAFWSGTVAVPAFYGSNPVMTHDYAYSLLLGTALALAGAADGQKVIVGMRNALLVFILAGILLVPVLPKLTVDLTYSGGLMSGVPRFAGLAVHPVTMGTLALASLLCLWHRPFEHWWLNWPAWLIGLAALFFAQSKTGWIVFIVAAIAIVTVRVRNSRSTALRIFYSAAIVASLLLAASMREVIEDRIVSFYCSAQGAHLLSLTGRTRLWGIALEEWHQNWWFGYGPQLWDVVFRAKIGIPDATDAHNQLMDTLARSGTVGAGALIVYSAVLLVLSIRYASSTRGLSLALFLALAMYGVSEVPMLLFSYGPEVLMHLLLVVTLASAAAARHPVAARLPGDLRTAA